MKHTGTIKRILSILLLLCMLLSCLKLTVFADSTTQDCEVVKQGSLVTSEDGMVTVHETATHTSGNNFNVTMTVTTSDLVEIEPVRPAHIVLCIDRSNSMDGQRRTNTKTAVEEFVSGVLNEDGIAAGNQIAVIGFGTRYWNHCSLTDDVSKVKSAVTAATNAVSDVNDGGTNVQAGLYAAQQVLAADNSTAQKVIVLFSDGMPTYSYRLTGTGDWTGCSGSGRRHSWNEHSGEISNLVTEFDHNTIVGSGSDYDYTRDSHFASLKVTCEHGRSTTLTNKIYTNNGQPAIVQAQKAKDAGIEIYTVFLDGYGYNEQSSKKNAEETMKSVATNEGHYMATQDMSELSSLFQSIGSSLVTPTNAGTVAAPMGSYIQLGEVSSLESVGITKTATGLTWNVTAVAPTVDLETGIRTYSVTYPISLQVEEPGFVEAKAHSVNSSAILTYSVGGAEKQISFDIPTIRGCLPSVPYSIRYYLQGDAVSGDYANYVLQDTDTGLFGKLYSKVGYPSGYEAKYPDHAFVYSSTGAELILSSTGANVMCLYYDSTYVPPVEACFNIRHEYYTNGELDGVITASQIAEEGSSVPGSSLDKALDYDGETYTYTSSVPAVLTVSEGSIITLLYDRTVVIPPAQVDYTVRHEYYTNGTFDGSTAIDLTNAAGYFVSATAIHKIPTYQNETYSFTSSTPSMLTLTEGTENTMILRYDRAVEIPPVEVNYTVRHEYYTNNEKTGVVTVDLTGDTGTVLDPAALSKLPVYGEKVYTYTSSTPSNLTLTEGENNIITLRYDRTEVLVSYTVLHEYYTNSKKDGTVPAHLSAPEGTEISVSTLEKNLSFSDSEYMFTSCTPARITLVPGEQYTITMRYDRTVETPPVEVGYTVIYEYYTNGEKTGETLIPQIGQDNTVIVGDDLSRIPTFNNEDYKYVESAPKELTLTPGTPAVIHVRYARTMEVPVTTKYTVIHQYYTGNKLDGQMQEILDADIGAIIEAAGLSKNTLFKDGSYTFTSANYEVLVVAKDGENKLILRYIRPSDAEDPDPQPSDNRHETPASLEDPGVIAPKTSDNSAVWLYIFAFSAASLVVLFVVPMFFRSKNGKRLHT